MLTFSADGSEADRQMRAVIFYLTTFGYIDGDFDVAEKTFVRDYIRRLVAARVQAALGDDDAGLSQELTVKYTTHFHEVFERVDHEVKELFTEAVSEGEAQDSFVHAKLKLRCFEIFKAFDEPNRERLLDSIDELIQADGQVHPAEAKFRGELVDLLNQEEGIELSEVDDADNAVSIRERTELPTARGNDPFFTPVERHYSLERDDLEREIAADRAMMNNVIALLDAARQKGAGRLKGRQQVGEFAGQAGFLDGFVQVLPPAPGKAYELTVVGDLHGCYSCLKAVLLQSNFFDKVRRYQAAPTQQPYPLLVMLGDYIDRGIFSYQGVLRLALQVFAAAPEHVCLLRGNHEYYIEHEGNIYGAVRPSEAMNTLKPHLSADTFQNFMRLFDALPAMLLFERFLFVHGGIPRDRVVKETYRDLSSLNEWDLRFQMMWSDPSSADVIPAALQEQSARFPFGRLQCQAFLQRLGCHTLVRGHEKVNEGFRRVYDDENVRLISLFSAGGRDNHDLPPESSYRSVTPMAMTLHFQDGKGTITPWVIDYQSFNDPDRNAFYRSKPQIEHRGG